MEDSIEITQEQKETVGQMEKEFTVSASQFQKFRKLWIYFVSIGGVVVLDTALTLDNITLILINSVQDQLTTYITDSPIWKIWVRQLSIYVWEEFQKLPDVKDMARTYYQKINILNSIDPALLLFIEHRLCENILPFHSYCTNRQLTNSNAQFLTRLLFLINNQYRDIDYINVYILPFNVKLIPNTINIIHLNKALYDCCSHCDRKKSTHYISSETVKDCFCSPCYLIKMQVLINHNIKTYYRVAQTKSTDVDIIVWRT